MLAGVGQSWVVSEESEVLADPVGIRVVLRSCFCGRLVESQNQIFNYKAKSKWSGVVCAAGQVSQITRSPITPAKQTAVGSRRTSYHSMCQYWTSFSPQLWACGFRQEMKALAWSLPGHEIKFLMSPSQPASFFTSVSSCVFIFGVAAMLYPKSFCVSVQN